MAPTTRTKAKAEPVEEPEEEFEEETDEDEDLEDLEEMEEEEETPAPKTKAKGTKAAAAPKKDPVKFGSPWLAAHVTEVTGETFDSRAIRMLLRKLAKDGTLEREVGVTRDRYEFTGPNDQTVKAILKMVQSGEAKAMKQAGLEKVKQNLAERKAAAAKAKAEAAEAEESDEDDDEEVEEAPKPTRTRRAAAKTAAPAKATPATTRRRTAATK